MKYFMYPSTSGDAIPSYPMDTGQSRTTFHDWPPVIMDDGILDSSATEIPKSQSRANRAIIHTHRRKRRNGPAGKHPHTPTGGQGRQAGRQAVAMSHTANPKPRVVGAIVFCAKISGILARQRGQGSPKLMPPCTPTYICYV